MESRMLNNHLSVTLLVMLDFMGYWGGRLKLNKFSLNLKAI